MSVDPKEHVPIYEQIVEHVCGLVAAGVHRPGEMLPSIRALALELVVNPNTVQRAYQELERQGLVTTRRGLGMFVPENGHASARRRSEAAVRSRFEKGIQVGRSADIQNGRLESIFRETLGAGLQSVDEPGAQEDPPATDGRSEP